MDCLKSMKMFFKSLFCISSCCDKDVIISVNENENEKHKNNKIVG